MRGGGAEREHPCIVRPAELFLSAVVAAAGSSTSSSRKQAILALSVCVCVFEWQKKWLSPSRTSRKISPVG